MSYLLKNLNNMISCTPLNVQTLNLTKTISYKTEKIFVPILWPMNYATLQRRNWFLKKKKKYKTNVAAQDRTGDLQCVRLT
jgi:hypothetical protein